MIYPNPLETESTIEIIPYENTIVPISRIIVYDMLGTEVYQEMDLEQSKVVLSKGRLNTGYYMIKALDENGGEYVNKLLVK